MQYCRISNYTVILSILKFSADVKKFQISNFETLQFSDGITELVNLIQVKHKRDSKTRNPTLDLKMRKLSVVGECHFE
jgi:hypothetical protein